MYIRSVTYSYSNFNIHTNCALSYPPLPHPFSVPHACHFTRFSTPTNARPTSRSTSSQVLGVKSSIRVGNAASNSVESGGGALAHDGAGTSGIASTATANPPVSATVSANPTHPHSTHKHLLRSRAKASGEQPRELPSSNKTSGKHHKKDTTTGSCSSSR